VSGLRHSHRYTAWSSDTVRSRDEVGRNAANKQQKHASPQQHATYKPSQSSNTIASFEVGAQPTVTVSRPPKNTHGANVRGASLKHHKRK
jgi:hypothetical protein